MYLFPVTAVTGYHKFSDLPPPSNTKVALLVKILLAKAGEAYSIPGSGRSPGGGHGNPLQYSCLENLMDRGAWRTTVHRVSKSWTRLKRLSTQTTQIFFPFIFISWRLITLQYCSGFCHALTWVSHGWIRKLWYIYTMEYYSAIKENSFESVLMRWMKLEPIIQSEVSQKDKDQYSILTHIYGI